MDSATVASAGPLPGLHRQAVRLEQFSIAWMLIEAGVAFTAGLIARPLGPHPLPLPLSFRAFLLSAPSPPPVTRTVRLPSRLARPTPRASDSRPHACFPCV